MTTRAYYNEIDPYAAQWLRNLIAAGHIAPGEVDERSITDVRADDLRGFVQCHFFAGIGGWDYALRLAGWPAERPIWTGSCPCQPFSVAGKGAGTSDERHLWPHWFRLIRECRPGVVFGEQVEAAIGHGWLDAVQTDLEGEGYAVGAVGLPAASVGAPHIRQRLWFVADSHKAGQRLERRSGLQHGERAAQRNNTYGCGAAGGMGDSSGEIFPQRIGNGRVQRETLESSTRQATVGTSDLGWLENAECATGARLGQHSGAGLREQEATGSCGSSGTGSWWGDSEWIYCTDEKYRPTKPGIFPLADGVAGRVGRLRAYGNAIVPQVAAQVIAAYMECRP